MYCDAPDDTKKITLTLTLALRKGFPDFAELPLLSVFLQAESLDGALCVPDIKLHSNPSAFNVYCNVRHCVLDWQQREASLALASRSSVQSGDSDSEEEEEYREPAVKLPKVWAGGRIGCLCGGSSARYQGESQPVLFIFGMQQSCISLVLYPFYCCDNWRHFNIGLTRPSCEDYSLCPVTPNPSTTLWAYWFLYVTP